MFNDIFFKGLNAFTILDAGKGIYTNIDMYLPFVLGLFALILAEVFHTAYQVNEENKLTI